MNQQQLSEICTYIGDGRKGPMRISSLALPPTKAAWKFKGWYHLVENLYKVGGDKGRLAKVEAFLWRGNLAAAIAEFDE